MVSFGERLREERVRAGLSQTEFGELAGVTKKTQMLYEADERVPDARYLIAANGAHVDVQYILTGERQISQKCPDVPADEQLLLDSYRALSASKKKQLLASLLTGDVAKKPAKSGGGVVVTGSGNKTAGRDYHE